MYPRLSHLFYGLNLVIGDNIVVNNNQWFVEGLLHLDGLNKEIGHVVGNIAAAKTTFDSPL